MNVDFRGWGRKAVSVRLFWAAVVLLAVAATVLGLGPRPDSTKSQRVSAVSSAVPKATQSEVYKARPLASSPEVLSRLSALPLRFEPNQGQTDERVRFLAHGTGYGLFLNAEGATIALNGRGEDGKAATDVIAMKIAGGNPAAKLAGTDSLPGSTSYFLGNDPSQWRRDIPQFARVKYEQVYPGIDLVFYGKQGHLEYDFRVAPGADPAKAELQFDGTTQIRMQGGNLQLKGRYAEVQLQAPHIYQEVDGREQAIAGRFVKRAANRVGFEVGDYDHSRELVIDPILSYATYFGGTGDETSVTVAVDGAGNIYMAGSTSSTPSTFPASGVSNTYPSPFPSGTHTFVTKITPSVTTAAVYEVFLGGSGTETNVGVAVDGAGNAYIAGTTTSSNYPTTINSYQTTPYAGSTGSSHVYVTALGFNSQTAAVTLNYSSYLSGNGTDIASGMAIDYAGNMFVTGTTTSTNAGTSTIEFPASAPPQAEPYQIVSRNAGGLQFFVTEVNTLSLGPGSIPYSTYFGGGASSGAAVAIGGGIAVDGQDIVYFSGTTNYLYTGTDANTDFPIINAYQPCLDQTPPLIIQNVPTCSNTSSTSAPDAFVAKLNPNPNHAGLSQLIWSTYFGGSATDSGNAVAIDPGATNVYLAGTTNSSDVLLPTNNIGLFQNCLNNQFTAGAPTTCTAQTANPAPNDAFVARFPNISSGFMTLAYFSYLGGSGNEAGLALTVDTTTDALLTGWTQSTPSTYPTTPAPGGFPLTPGAIQSSLYGAQDAFYARINTSASVGTNPVGSYLTYYGGSTASTAASVTSGTGIAIDPNLNTYFTGNTNTAIQLAGPLQGTEAGGYDAYAVRLGPAAALTVSGQLSLGAGQQYISAGNPATFTYTITNNGPDVATNISLVDTISPLVTLVPVTFVSATTTPGICSQSATATSAVVCTIPYLQSGSTANVVIVLTPTTSGNFNGGAVQVTGSNSIVPASSQVPAQASDFSVTVSPSGQSVSAGQTIRYSVLLTPTFVYNSTISLSVTGLPSGANGNFSPASVTLLGPQAPSLTISTTARNINIVQSRWRAIMYAVFMGIPGVGFVGIGFSRDRRKRKLYQVLTLCFLLALFVVGPACNSPIQVTPPIGTPAGTYTLTVTATSGTLTHSQTFTMTVL